MAGSRGQTCSVSVTFTTAAFPAKPDTRQSQKPNRHLVGLAGVELKGLCLNECIWVNKFPMVETCWFWENLYKSCYRYL